METNQTLHFVGLSGSLRENSYNTALLREAGHLLPSNTTFTLADLSDIPMYNQDFESPLPASVRQLKDLVKSADGVIMSTPEFNLSIPAVLKNAIDWLTRPSGQSSIDGKPVAIMGATMGMFGTMGAQIHLRQILNAINMHPVNKPSVMISAAHTKFDAVGHLTDEAARGFLKQLMDNLVDWTNLVTVK